MVNVNHRNFISNEALAKSTVSGSSIACVCKTGSATDYTHEATTTDPFETVTMETGTTAVEMDTVSEGSGDDYDNVKLSPTSTTSLEASTHCVCDPVTTLWYETKG